MALDKETGKEVWRRKDAGFSGTWGTPILVECGKGRTDLVIAVPFKIWGFNPDDGKPRWQCEGLTTDFICASALAHGDVVYALETGPRGGGAIAVDIHCHSTFSDGLGTVEEDYAAAKRRQRALDVGNIDSAQVTGALEGEQIKLLLGGELFGRRRDANLIVSSGLKVVLHVLLNDPATRAGALDAGWVDDALVSQSRGARADAEE